MALHSLVPTSLSYSLPPLLLPFSLPRSLPPYLPIQLPASLSFLPASLPYSYLSALPPYLPTCLPPPSLPLCGYPRCQVTLTCSPAASAVYLVPVGQQLYSHEGQVRGLFNNFVLSIDIKTAIVHNRNNV